LAGVIASRARASSAEVPLAIGVAATRTSTSWFSSADSFSMPFT
jgi:hypothetical protein